MKIARISGPQATPKGLRHRYGIKAVISNVPLNTLQTWLGHADLKTTSIYAGARRTEEQKIGERVWL